MFLKNKKLLFQQFDKSRILFFDFYKWLPFKDWLHIKLKALWIANLQGSKE